MATALDHPDHAHVTAALGQFADLGGPDFVTEMVNLLRTQTPDQFNKIDAGLAIGDLSAVRRQAHSMKSSFGNFGALDCQRLATAMDLAGKEGRTDDFIRHYGQLRNAYDRLIALLEKIGR